LLGDKAETEVGVEDVWVEGDEGVFADDEDVEGDGGVFADDEDVAGDEGVFADDEVVDGASDEVSSANGPKVVDGLPLPAVPNDVVMEDAPASPARPLIPLEAPAGFWRPAIGAVG